MDISNIIIAVEKIEDPIERVIMYAEIVSYLRGVAVVNRVYRENVVGWHSLVAQAVNEELGNVVEEQISTVLQIMKDTITIGEKGIIISK